MPDTLRLAVHAPTEARDALVARLAAAGFDAFEDTPAALVAYAPDGAVPRDAVGLALTDAGLGWDHVVETTVPDQNWNAVWEATIQPTRVGPFVVAPTWADLPADLAALTVLRVDPKMAFGTGYHESTRLALGLLAPRVVPGGRVLDVGAGTGVLALAALKTGAASAVGVDIDPWSVENARENAELNGVADRFENRLGSIEEVPETGFSLVLANILRVILVPMMPDLAAHLAPGGTLVLAGILQSERQTMLDAAAASGLALAAEATENEWWAAALTAAPTPA
ncbi:MAG TPA: 50S ribosomal protein L11 methyltransferase [Rubricoccaceae bacterium]|jgi:ribosomal protein L11 methyltransferase